MKAQLPLKIEIPNLTVRILPPTPVRMTPHHVSPDELVTRAIDLAVKATPLTVPAFSLQKPSSHTTQQDLELLATRPTDDTLIDEHGGVYHLEPVTVAGSFGAVRIGTKKDSVIDRRFIFKEMRRMLPDSASPTSARKDAKTMNLRPFNEDSLRNEVDLMLKVGSPLAPQVVLKTDDRFFVGMPALPGDLLDAINYIHTQHPQQLSTMARNIMMDVAAMLVKLEEKNVSHRDLKLENLLYTTDGHVLLADYGLSENQASVRGITGTPLYLPPETFASMRVNWQKANVEEQSYNGIKADIWSLGMTVLQALVVSDDNPFDMECFYDGTLNVAAVTEPHEYFSPMDLASFLDLSLKDVINNMRDFADASSLYRDFYKDPTRTTFPRTDFPAFDSHMRKAYRTDAALLSVILDTLDFDPAKRPSAAQIVERMQHSQLRVTPAEQRDLVAALAQRTQASGDSGYASDSSSDSWRLVSRHNTAL